MEPAAGPEPPGRISTGTSGPTRSNCVLTIRISHFGWSNYEDYDGGGQSWGVTGWGTHSLDQVQCALGTDDTGPVEIWLEEKGKDGWPKVMLRYASGTVLKLVGERHTMEDLGAIFVGEKGKIEILRGHARANPQELLKDAPPNTPNGPLESVPHIQELPGLREEPPETGRRCGNRPPGNDCLPPDQHLPQARPEAPVGSES